MTLVQEGNVEMLKINEQIWLHVMNTITYRRYYNKYIERNLEGDTSDLMCGHVILTTLGDLVLLFTNMCYFPRIMKYKTKILITHHIERLGIH